MARITVKFYSLWNLYLNKNTLELEAGDLDEAMEQLDLMFSDRLRETLHKRNIQFENFKESSTMLLNGVSLRNINDRNLKNGDILHVFPPIAGG